MTLAQWQDAMKPETKMLFLETPANPTLAIVDIAGVVKIAKKVGARVVVDNAFANPALQRPMEFGADIVIHSSTKYIDGQGRCLGGVILCREDFLKDHLQIFLRNTGPAISPFNAWVHLKSLETLDLRMRGALHQCGGSRRFSWRPVGNIPRLVPVPRRPSAARARPRADGSGGGGVVTFEIEGGKEAAFRFVNALRLIDISNNLGDAKSLITHPATTTHQRLSPEARAALGVTEGMMRLSVGLEDEADLCEDIAAALAAV